MRPERALWQFRKDYMVIVAQLVRASDCGSEGRGFESRLSPKNSETSMRSQSVVLSRYMDAS